MVVYWNGRAMREKWFDNRESAIRFINKIDDDKATLWKQQEII